MINPNAQSLGRLGGLANKGKPKSAAHKLALQASLAKARGVMTSAIKSPAISQPEAIPAPRRSRRCMTSFCLLEPSEYQIQGSTVWLCDAHKPKQ